MLNVTFKCYSIYRCLGFSDISPVGVFHSKCRLSGWNESLNLTALSCMHQLIAFYTVYTHDSVPMKVFNVRTEFLLIFAIIKGQKVCVYCNYPKLKYSYSRIKILCTLRFHIKYSQWYSKKLKLFLSGEFRRNINTFEQNYKTNPYGCNIIMQTACPPFQKQFLMTNFQ